LFCAHRLLEEEIETRVQALREKLLAEVDSSFRIDPRGLKPHQVHELAAAKMGMFLLCLAVMLELLTCCNSGN
jgi:hypothetical protein